MTIVQAPLERLWALSTRVELVKTTLGMEPVGGVTSGFVSEGARVVWRGWKFGLPTEHHTLITGWEPPAERDGERTAWFQDSQERGRFAFFQHGHAFREVESADGPVTILADHVKFALPLWLGDGVSARLLLKPFIERLVRKRFLRLKGLAEGEGWREWADG